MISIIITAYKEPNSVGKAIGSFLNQDIKEEYEILVVCPDKETREIVKKYEKRNKQVKHIQDSGKGKPAALNTVFKKAKGDVLILTDGDVYVSRNCVNNLIKHFSDPKIGEVSGRPISISPRNTMLGFWSHLLTDAGAHSTRLERAKKGKFIVCTGYLCAIRNIIKRIPEDALSDDAVISHMIAKKGYKIGYEPKAKVYVKYPSTFNDWIIQKIRSTGGYNQIDRYFGKMPKMRTFWREVFFGWYKAITYAKSITELYWTVLLFIARLYLWLRIFTDLHLRKKKLKDVWIPVKSTK